jgi:hypothetical protein
MTFSFLNVYQLTDDDADQLLPLLDLVLTRSRAVDKYDDLDDYEVQQCLAEFGVDG